MGFLKTQQTQQPTKEDLLMQLSELLTVEELIKLVKAVKNPITKKLGLNALSKIM